MRDLSSPNKGSTVTGVLSPSAGGLGTVNAAGIKTALNTVDKTAINQNNGVAGLVGGKIPVTQLPTNAASNIGINGPTEVVITTTVQYTITNFDMFTDYVVTPIAGSVTRNRDVISYTAPSTVVAGGFKINGRTVAPTIIVASPAKPSITSPTNNAVGVSSNYTFTSSAFVPLGDQSTHQSSDWQVSTSPTFATVPFSSIDSTTNKVSYTVSGLSASTAYYVRVRYKGSNGNYGVWSDVTSFTTSSSYTLALTVSADTTNYDMKAMAIINGWDQILPLNLTVTVNNGVKIGSTTTASSAFTTGINFPVGTVLKLINNGTIMGAGGGGGAPNGLTGGTALLAQYPLTVTNNGEISGGGGGGGAGAGGQGNSGGTSVGGGGGGGQGYTPGSGGGTNGSGSGPYAYYSGASAGSAGSLTGPGAGGAGAYGHDVYVSPNTYLRGGSGGGGGTLGAPGGAGSAAYNAGENIGVVYVGPGSYPAGAGGAAGNYVSGNSFVSWLSTGTRKGNVS